MFFGITLFILFSDLPLLCSPSPLHFTPVCTVCPLPLSVWGEPISLCLVEFPNSRLTKTSCSMLPGLFPPPLAQKPLWLSTDATQDEIICMRMSGRQRLY